MNWSEDELRQYLARRNVSTRSITKISEKVFQIAVRDMALTNKWKYYHTFNSMRSDQGFPDTIMLRGERMIVNENKSETGNVTESQQDWLEAFKLVKEIGVYIWRPSDLNQIWHILKA